MGCIHSTFSSSTSSMLTQLLSGVKGSCMGMLPSASTGTLVIVPFLDCPIMADALSVTPVLGASADLDAGAAAVSVSRPSISLR